MQLFTELYSALDRTTRTNDKVEALRAYFKAAPPADAIWAVYLITGRKIGRTVSSRQMREWVAETAGYPSWLIDECYHLVGDLSETLSLMVPGGVPHAAPPTLREMIEEHLAPLGHMTAAEQKKGLLAIWPLLTPTQRLVMHKLISREFRVGVSRLLLVRALAEVAGIDSQLMAHRLSGEWKPTEATMRRLMAPADANADEPIDPAMPYPFMLAHPLTGEPASLGPLDDWLIEWKWDGIRAQLIRRGELSALWSRGDERVGGAFPELINAGRALPGGTVLDGEIVAWDEAGQRPLSFAKLQRRLNRKNVELSFWPDVPVIYIAFDLLELNGEDQRGHTLDERRQKLERLLADHPHPLLRISSPVTLNAWEETTQHLGQSRDRAVEGFMVKQRCSVYQAGRPTGLWWKLKVEPYTVDAVLIAAQAGHGRRAGLLTDYTFGVWDDSGALVSFAKAYSGLTDDEISDVDRWVRRHTTERYGPVHSVEPELVFELGFEAINASDRHKSGIAVRFPRILRQRTDKKPKDADSLASLRALLAESEARG